VSSAAQTTAGRLVAAVVDADANGLKSLASAITATPGHVTVLVSSSRPALVVVARSQDLSAAANQVVAALTSTFGGRGGGKADLAQAGGLDGDPAAILDAARALIS